MNGLPDPSRLLCISLDDLVSGDRETVYAELLEFTGLDDDPAMRAFFEEQMSASAAHMARWREDLSDEQQADLEREYERLLSKLEREGFHCAPQLRAAYEHQPA